MAKELLDLICELFEENKRPDEELRKEWESLTQEIEKSNATNESYKYEYDYTKMTDEELEEEAVDLAGEAWQMVLRGYVKNPPETFEEMVESMKAYLKEKNPPESINS